MKREICPCCGFLTLEERGIFDICILCKWEDDGQDDPYVDEVWDGPNGDYSLTEARKNFKENLVMYRDNLSQTDKEIETKKSLINAFLELGKCDPDSPKYNAIWNKITSFEKML